MRIRFLMAVLVLILGCPTLLSAADNPDGDTGGVYRPFSTLRRFKLATAYFVNPELVPNVRLAYAYRLERAVRLSGDSERTGVHEIASSLEQGTMRLAVHVEGSDGFLTPTETGCKKQLEDDGAISTYDSCAEFLSKLLRQETGRFYVLSENDLTGTGQGRFVTWDPTEHVPHKVPWGLRSWQ